MPLFVTEYRNKSNNGIPSLPGLGTFNMSVGTTLSTGAVGANTQVIGVASDVGCLLLVTSSGSTIVATSTNAQRIPPNIPPQLFNVDPYSRLSVLTT